MWQNSPLLRRRQPAVIANQIPQRRIQRERAVMPGRTVMLGTIESAAKLDALRERAKSLPLEQFEPGDPELFRADTFWPYFDRLRREEPVLYCKDSMFGPY